jgi:hypothetical protein
VSATGFSSLSKTLLGKWGWEDQGPLLLTWQRHQCWLWQFGALKTMFEGTERQKDRKTERNKEALVVVEKVVLFCSLRNMHNGWNVNKTSYSRFILSLHALF